MPLSLLSALYPEKGEEKQGNNDGGAARRREGDGTEGRQGRGHRAGVAGQGEAEAGVAGQGKAGAGSPGGRSVTRTPAGLGSAVDHCTGAVYSSCCRQTGAT